MNSSEILLYITEDKRLLLGLIHFGRKGVLREQDMLADFEMELEDTSFVFNYLKSQNIIFFVKTSNRAKLTEFGKEILENFYDMFEMLRQKARRRALAISAKSSFAVKMPRIYSSPKILSNYDESINSREIFATVTMNTLFQENQDQSGKTRISDSSEQTVSRFVKEKSEAETNEATISVALMREFTDRCKELVNG